MKKFLFLILVSLFLTTITSSQNLDTPSKKISFEEQMEMGKYLNDIKKKSNLDIYTTPPNFSVRTMAEWEEIQALTIAWEGFEPILTEIVIFHI